MARLREVVQSDPVGDPYMSFVSRWIERASVRKRATDLATLHTLLGPTAGARLIDIGGGTGAATERFSSGCAEVVVLEPDSRKVREGRRLRLGIQFQEGRGEEIPFPDAAFDRVTAVTAFHHVEDQEIALREMRRVLKDSGRIVLFELLPSRAPGPLCQWLAGYRHGGHMVFHGPAELTQKLQAAGLREVTNRPGVTGYFVTATK